MHPARLFIVCGLPGSGKRTRSLELAERFRAVRLGPDEWMERLGTDLWDEEARGHVERIQGELAAELLRAGTSVVIEWGTWMRVERDRLRSRAVGSGALAHLELLDAPIDELWQRIDARGREAAAGSRAITRDDLVEWSDLIERPTADELADYDPWPPVRAGEQPGSPAFPYGTWQPTTQRGVPGTQR